MKIEPYNHGMDGYNIEIDVDGDTLKFWERAEIVHALIRRGMQHQRERDAKWLAHEAPGLASELRAQPIELADIEAAIGEGE